DVTGFHGTTLSIDTGSGDVTGSDFESDELSVDTGSGEVRLTGVTSPRVSLETGSGRITADLRRDIASLQVETGSGDIAIRAPATLGAAVEIETSSGDIETDFPLLVTRQRRGHGQRPPSQLAEELRQDLAQILGVEVGGPLDAPGGDQPLGELRVQLLAAGEARLLQIAGGLEPSVALERGAQLMENLAAEPE